MKWKSWLLAGLGLTPMAGTAQESNTNDTLTQKNKIEVVKDSVTTDSARHKSKTLNLKPLNKNPSETADTMATDTLEELDTFLPVDSAAIAWGNLSAREKVLSCSEQILLFITQFEDIKAQSYIDRTGGQRTRTVGPGITTIDGKKLPEGYRIPNMTVLFDLWNKEFSKEGGWADNLVTYLGEVIDNMKPTTEKELLQCKSIIDGWHSFQWQNGVGTLGSNGKKSALAEAYTRYILNNDTAAYNKAKTLFHKYCKVTLRNKRTGKPIIRNGKVVKITLPSSVARRTAEWDNIDLRCITGIGPCPKVLENDSTVQYVDILETKVGGIHSVRNQKTGKLPEDWPQKVQEVAGDTVTVRYQKQFSELRSATDSPSDKDKKEEEVDTNPLLRFFRTVRSRFE